VADADIPHDCYCDCTDPPMKPASKKVQQKKKLKVKLGARYNVCARNVPITKVAQFLDRSLPNRILVPVNKLTKNVTLNLKKKTFKQIIVASGLVIKN
jgi:hypothetical protein